MCKSHEKREALLSIEFVFFHITFPIIYQNDESVYAVCERAIILFLVCGYKKLDSVCVSVCNYRPFRGKRYRIYIKDPMFHVIEQLLNEGLTDLAGYFEYELSDEIKNRTELFVDKNKINIGRIVINKVFLLQPILDINDILCVITDVLFKVL